jgi:hypothetical protein
LAGSAFCEKYTGAYDTTKTTFPLKVVSFNVVQINVGNPGIDCTAKSAKHKKKKFRKVITSAAAVADARRPNFHNVLDVWWYSGAIMKNATFFGTLIV